MKSGSSTMKRGRNHNKGRKGAIRERGRGSGENQMRLSKNVQVLLTWLMGAFIVTYCKH